MACVQTAAIYLALTATTIYLLEAKKYLHLPLIAVLWVNLHGGTMPILYFLTGMHFLFEGKKILKLWPCILGIVCGVLINPRGIEMLYYSLAVVGDPLQMHIAEWHSPDFKAAYTFCFAAVLILGPFFLERRWRDGLIYAVLASLSILYLRNIPIFIIFAIPLIFSALRVKQLQFKISPRIVLLFFLISVLVFPVPTLA